MVSTNTLQKRRKTGLLCIYRV